MTKRLTDVDSEQLAAVQQLLGAPTLKAAIAGALDEVIALDRRWRALLAERGVEAPDLADPAERHAAWG